MLRRQSKSCALVVQTQFRFLNITSSIQVVEPVKIHSSNMGNKSSVAVRPFDFFKEPPVCGCDIYYVSRVPLEMLQRIADMAFALRFVK